MELEVKGKERIISVKSGSPQKILNFRYNEGKFEQKQDEDPRVFARIIRFFKSKVLVVQKIESFLVILNAKYPDFFMREQKIELSDSLVDEAVALNSMDLVAFGNKIASLRIKLTSAEAEKLRVERDNPDKIKALEERMEGLQSGVDEYNRNQCAVAAEEEEESNAFADDYYQQVHLSDRISELDREIKKSCAQVSSIGEKIYTLSQIVFELKKLDEKLGVSAEQKSLSAR